MSALSNEALLDPALRQRGRASVNYLVALGRCLGSLGQEIGNDMARLGVTNETLPDDIDDANAIAIERLSHSSPFRVQQLISEFHSRTSGPITAEAFQEIKPELAPLMRKLDNDGPTTLELGDDFVPPSYWTGIDFHRTTGGWDAFPNAGYVHGELIHKLMVEKLFPGGIFAQRRKVASLAPRRDYDRVLEMGSSTGHYTLALAETFPDAEITGVDVSESALRQARRVGNAKGYAWRLFRRNAEDTGFTQQSFDFVTSYILLHEIPAEAIRAVFAESFRVLKPGGDMLMSDATRYAALDKVGRFKADYGALHGGEPYWRETASLDLAEVARSVGFIDVRSEGVDGANYPWIVYGRRPA